MRQVRIYILIILISISCNDDSHIHYPNILTYNDINNTLLDLLESDSSTIFNKDYIFPVLFSNNLYDNIDTIKKLIPLKKEDIQFMLYQDSIYSLTYLNPLVFNDYKFVDYNNPQNLYQIYRIPLISIDKNYMIVERGYDAGFLSGTFYILIYKKINEKWVEIHRIFDHMS